ncbi:glycoside hydrolase family 66 protein [Niallia sp. FSL W8-1348]|uniref:glycoside hydrolase family 66 protein n=1 Tax=Niallia sp. FSL W8-1348 TaxID=2954656 RepID=UPI0030FCE892
MASKKTKWTVLITLLLAVPTLISCKSNASDSSLPNVENPGQWITGVHTDKAVYTPGEKITFQLTFQKEVEKGDLIIKYKHLAEDVEEQKIQLTNASTYSWEWDPGKDDYKGYMVEVFLKDGKKTLDHQNIAVDVSTDWSKFPRYGYLADFPSMSEEGQQKVIDNLNRYHINGLQFYDWLYRHDQPAKIENGVLAEEWNDIANRVVSKQTIENYIKLAHDKNMKAMNYNLLFGAFEGYEENGVEREWGIFKDAEGKVQDSHDLPDSWASDIYLMDPSNPEWQEYIINTQKDVFQHLDFDGWHVDQLGDRGRLWNGKGEEIDLSKTYTPLLEKAKQELQKDIVMNAVDQYAQKEIAEAPINFMYSEIWSAPTYESVKKVIDQNDYYSNGELNSVLAAYMNYELSDFQGMFNTPGILMTNAVIFAAGGSHLELGENMLSKEYFPHKNLTISTELKEQLVHYYDFLVAYQNLLRDDVKEITKMVKSEEKEIKNYPAVGSIWNFTKAKDKKEIYHLINFTDATTLEWKDNQGIQAEPQEIKDIPLTIDVKEEIDKIWVASPDINHGSAQEIKFKQKDGKATITLLSLKYWDMVVVEYK